MKPARIAELNAKVEAEYARNKARVYPETLPKQMDIPVARYVDPRLYELENQHVWSKVWLLAGHADELPEVGSYKLWTLSGQQVILVRGKDRQIRAFFNSCRHRGAALIREPHGKQKVFACKFHAWTYDLQGDLVFVPEENDFPCLDKKQNGLVQLRCESWGNLIFVNRDPQAQPLLEYLGRATDELAHFEFESWKLGARTERYELKCNWKTAIEAFLEAYHVDTVHPQTVAPFLDSRGVVFEMWNRTTLMVLPNYRDKQFKYSSSDSGDPRHELTRAASLNFEIFPNAHVPLTEFTAPFMIFWPTGIASCVIEVLYLESPHSPLSSEQQEQLVYSQVDTVLREDFSNVEAQQRTNESGAFKHIHIGAREWRIYRWHEIIDEMIGAEKIPAELRIPTLLGPTLG
ncbi:MAG: aromatic ring-hydroxylating dioxygenase subunit alpha [Steroidobacteraceae bacterium]